VHISDLSFLSTIYANRGRNQPSGGGSLLVQHSVAATEDWDLHKQRRDALNPYFSQKSVLSLEPLLKEKTQELREWFDDAMRLQKPINLSDAFYAFSNEYFASMVTRCVAEKPDG
jgi:cytochrome P450